MTLESIVENVWARGFARYIMPIAITMVLATSGWALSWGINKIADILEKHGDKIDAAAQRAGETAKEVKSLRNESALRFEETGKRLDGVSTKIDRFDDRIRFLEIKGARP